MTHRALSDISPLCQPFRHYQKQCNRRSPRAGVAIRACHDLFADDAGSHLAAPCHATKPLNYFCRRPTSMRPIKSARRPRLAEATSRRPVIVENIASSAPSRNAKGGQWHQAAGVVMLPSLMAAWRGIKRSMQANGHFMADIKMSVSYVAFLLLPAPPAKSPPLAMS